ncbi:hypothetical protein THMIRHAM_04820 [Thiomicrorhabdus immobilis]|uniref:Uncharacterized protein n=1 Tax=Thiomicrorhabdus immobilis TaxID=2791037 RepID=A0ABN6CXU4_9GAMM|nr:hypothetical protein THMIRHAM_04820 [Thiomicrorhabdus immobilis]
MLIKLQISDVMPFMPNVFVDITKFIDINKQVLEIYTEEMRKPLHSRSFDNAIKLNSMRVNTVEFNYVEAFQLMREIK